MSWVLPAKEPVDSVNPSVETAPRGVAAKPARLESIDVASTISPGVSPPSALVRHPAKRVPAASRRTAPCKRAQAPPSAPTGNMARPASECGLRVNRLVQRTRYHIGIRPVQ